MKLGKHIFLSLFLVLNAVPTEARTQKKKKKRRSKYLKSIEFVELEIYCLLMYRELAIINTTFGPSLGYHLVQD